MQRVYVKELKDVKQFLDRGNRRQKLTKFQSDVKTELKRSFQDPNIIGLVKDVFSRAEADSDHPIKSEKKIAIKLYKWNKGKKRNLKKPKDVHDIAGITIVSYYPSDAEKLVETLSNNFTSDFFTLREFKFRDPNETGGYRAHHGVADGMGVYRGLSCEIQIKTLLTMSWGAKTHDLTYKPVGEIDKRLRLYMDKLTTIAQILDDQSEILKDLISEAWELDARRRDTARKQMLLRLIDSKDERLTEILAYITENAKELSVMHLNEQKPMWVENQISRYLSDVGYTKEICRVACVYALGRAFGDLADWALELIDEWIEGVAKDDEMFRHAVVFRSLASMALGEYEEAIEAGRSVLTLANTTKKSNFVCLANANLAYFLAEAYFHRAFDEASGGGALETDATENCGQEAIHIVKLLETDHLDELNSQAKDTIGAVLIACGNNEEQIRRGLAYCEQARDDARGQGLEDAMDAFFSLHEKRAFRRLLAI